MDPSPAAARTGIASDTQDRVFSSGPRASDAWWLALADGQRAEVLAQAGHEVARRSVSGVLGYYVLLAVILASTPYLADHLVSALALTTVLLLSGAVRLRLASRLRAGPREPTPREAQLQRAAVYVTAVGWSTLISISVALYPWEWPMWLLLFCGSGLASGATTSLAPDWRLAQTYLLMVTLPPALMLASQPTPRGLTLAVVVGAFLVFLRRQVASHHDWYWQSVRDRVTIGDLNRQLRRETTAATAARERAEEQLQSIVDALPNYVWSCHARSPDQLTYDYCSSPVEQVTGRPPAFYHAANGRWISTVHPDDRAHMAVCAHRLLSGVVDQWEERYRIVRPDGRVRWVQDRALVTRSPDGRRLIRGVVSDVTDEQEAQERHRQSEARYRALVEQSLVGVFVVRGGRYRYVNPRLAEIFGYTVDELVALPSALDVVSEEDRDRVARTYVQDGAGAVASCRYRGRTRDGSRVTVEADCRPAELDGLPVTIGMLIDVTERERLAGELRQSQKMDSIGRLAGGVAHDFNNVLMVIGGHVEVLLGRHDLDIAARLRIEKVKQAADHAAALTRQLLAFSRRQVLRPEPTVLNAVLTGLEDMLRRLLGEDIGLVLTLDERLGPVLADPDQLRQVVINLSVNARDAMPQGGTLTLETGTVEHPVAPPGRPGIEGRAVVLRVRDTGHGIAQETLEHLFEPFFTTKEPGQGTGLGLATVYGIVQQSGGWMEVETGVGRGTDFIVTFPECETTRLPLADERGSDAPSVQASQTILVVEDDDELRALVTECLREAGHDVLDAPTAEDALTIAARHDGRMHLLIVDVVLSGLNGREFVERYRLAHGSVPVLYVSGHTDDEVLRRGIRRRDVAYLEKPFTLAALTDNVRRLLSRES